MSRAGASGIRSATAAGVPENGGWVFSSGIDLDCGKLRGCVMGFRGVGLRVSALRSLPSIRIPRACFLADDVAITHYLTRLRGLAIWRLKLRTRYKFDDAFAWHNSSINAMHRAHAFRINKACVAALLANEPASMRETRQRAATAAVPAMSNPIALGAAAAAMLAAVDR